MSKSVLVIGFDPALLDFTTPEAVAAKVTADKVMAGIPKVLERLRAQKWDCVLIGAGVRTTPKFLLLFEKLLNLVHEHAPQARICFSTSPHDSVDAIKRWT